MKKITYILLTCIAFLFIACEPDEPSFDQSLLIGKWQSNTLYYRYDANKSGATWDTADDVTEEEAQPFTWTLDKSTLTHMHIMVTGGNQVPKIYTVTQLSATTLAYKDEFNKNFTFTKINQ